ncbi:hypothetical protein L0B53_14980 [Vibrio sp. SS-MA-C1-2]|uniref:hypothetical protein n=1 Tax=Vibrio sp. SS-MA-C1-2 TaxID=2908646 RepID=UPI001F2D7BC6|nr:hypothetical protein [Vibrio sp. SS-MA-C1-2]UJF18311.1 hypothetical protein L0B53_14980 [Vibrio sp. SS-MA-C1-2]
MADHGKNKEKCVYYKNPESHYHHGYKDTSPHKHQHKKCKKKKKHHHNEHHHVNQPPVVYPPVVVYPPNAHPPSNNTTVIIKNDNDYYKWKIAAAVLGIILTQDSQGNLINSYGQPVAIKQAANSGYNIEVKNNDGSINAYSLPQI